MNAQQKRWALYETNGYEEGIYLQLTKHIDIVKTAGRNRILVHRINCPESVRNQLKIDGFALEIDSAYIKISW